jgi:hypothetical protein
VHDLNENKTTWGVTNLNSPPPLLGGSLAERKRGRATCPVDGCHLFCGNAGGLTKHLRGRHPKWQRPQANFGPRVKKARQPYSHEQKSRALTRYYILEEDASCPWPHKQAVEEFFGAQNYMRRKGYLTRWLDAAEQMRLNINDIRSGKNNKRYKNGSGRRPDFPDCEDELYIRVIGRRVHHGFPVNHFWLQLEFEKILTEVRPSHPKKGDDYWEKFKCSWGWTVGFCVRYSLTTQAKNNIKAHDVVERTEALQSFHRYWLSVVQPSPPQTCAKYGRFGPKNILHCDQVPLPFASPHTTTLNPKGAKTCRIAGPNTSGMEKRQSTLQLWICADWENQYVLPTLIFRGSRGPKSKLPWPAELAHYMQLGNVRVSFQPNAWADGEFCEEDILNVAGDCLRAGVEGEVLIGMDNHSAQRTDEIRKLYGDLGFMPLFTAANCTDCISPVDHHIGRFIQNHMARSYRKEVSDHPEIWMATSADDDIADAQGNAAMQRRMLMASWLSEAWKDLQSPKYNHMIKSAFVHTGFLLALDGSEDHLLNLQGWAGDSPYTFR